MPLDLSGMSLAEPEENYLSKLHGSSSSLVSYTVLLSEFVTTFTRYLSLWVLSGGIFEI